MSKLMIIFAENGRLFDSYPQFIREAGQDLLVDSHLWFLNGNRVSAPLESVDDHIGGPGILLVYDAHDNPTYGENDTVEMIRQLSQQYSEFYICYHDRTEHRWSKALKSLGLNHAKKPLARKHTEEPYYSLHRFHTGELSLDDLTIHWDVIDPAAVPQKRAELLTRLDAIYERQCPEDLSDEKTIGLVLDCEFNTEEAAAYTSICAKLYSKTDRLIWHTALLAFRKQIG